MKKILFLAMLSMALAFTSCNLGGGGDEDSEDVNVTGVSLQKTSLTVAVGGGEILEYTITPQEANDQEVTWSSSDPEVVTVDERGLVEGVKIGSAIITITTNDGGKTATCEVTVVAEIVEVTGITLAPTTATVQVAATTTLVATVMPANASDKTVTWTTSDATIATVAGGVVTGVKAGTATITATTNNDEEATCEVTVKQDAPLSPEYTTVVEASQGIAPTGDGTQANPYLLASADNLRWMKVQCLGSGGATRDKYYKLTTDINVTANEWVAIQKFQGHFDGDNHKITGKLTADATVEYNFGFIGSTHGGWGSIKNLKMEAEVSAPNANVIGAVLGIANSLHEGSLSFVITNCTNSGKITGKGTVGGIVGNMYLLNNNLESLEHTLLDNCINTGEIVASTAAAGIAGSLSINPKQSIDASAVKVIIKNCNNSGNVSNTGNFSGGIVGNAETSNATIIVKGCTNTGVIKSGETKATIQRGDGSNQYLGLIVGGTLYGNCVITIE